MNDKLAITAIRALATDMIDEANSGHPGMSIGAAPILHTLFTRHIVATSANPNWIKRDRFCLSSGHTSALLYSLLHLSGYDLSLDDLKQFRQVGSKTPGHPEYGEVEGVDIGTGPLGQGVANAVGMAMAERHLCATYPNLSHLLEHYTYALCGDGDLQEGVCLEAMSIAGLNKLNKLIVIQDNNDVTLDGPLSQSSIDDTAKKVEAMGWNVIVVEDGNDVEKIDEAIIEAENNEDKPTFIIVKTIIGYGAAKQGTSKVHGSPLTIEGSLVAKKAWGWDHERFYIPEEVKADYQTSCIGRGLMAYMDFNKQVDHLSDEDKKVFDSILNVNIYEEVKNVLPVYEEGYKNSTRKVSGEILNIIGNNTKQLFGGSADVAGSTMTEVKGVPFFGPNCYEGSNVNFGIREHAMLSIVNGIAAHGGLLPYGGAFLVFSDYARGAIRMACLMGLPSLFVFSHDSIAVGEDGPTHQPIEQMASLRLIPNMNLIRPADANEVVGAYIAILNSKNNPTSLILTRQNVETVRGCSAEGVLKGAYILAKEESKLDAVLIATGSEVELAYKAKKVLKEQENIDVRVVSMPSTFLFDKQSDSYKESVIPSGANTLAIEMGVGAPWYKYAKNVMSIETFGASGPASKVIEKYGFTVNDVVAKVKEIVK